MGCSVRKGTATSTRAGRFEDLNHDGIQTLKRATGFADNKAKATVVSRQKGHVAGKAASKTASISVVVDR